MANSYQKEFDEPYKSRQTIYIPHEMLKEIKAECVRQDRSVSKLIQTAWKIARAELMQMQELP